MNHNEGTEKHGGSIKVTDRKSAELTGIMTVVSFDENRISLVGTLGALSIEGEDLHITTLDLSRGIVEATGRIDAVIYEDERENDGRGGWFSRLLGR